MTREEATIQALQGHIEALNETIEKQEKAIKELEQQPSEDCVSRQALDKALYEHFHDEDAPNNITEVRLGTIRNFVKDFPPVASIRKKGKWILHEKSISTGFKDLRECSCCKCYFDWIMPRNSYCPNCGAEMESEE